MKTTTVQTDLQSKVAVLNNICVQSVNFGCVDIYRRAFCYDYIIKFDAERKDAQMLNGNFKIGTDRSNKNQVKRMANQFGDEFISAKAADLVELVHSGNIKYSRHLVKKMRRENLNVPTIVIAKTIAHAKTSFIEFSYLRGNCKWHRALLRDYSTVENVMIDGEIKKCNLCFVIDFNCGEIVTAYWNEATDLHKTLDMKKYV